MSYGRDKAIPEVLSFLRLVWEQEDGYEVETDKQMPDLG